MARNLKQRHYQHIKYLLMLSGLVSLISCQNSSTQPVSQLAPPSPAPILSPMKSVPSEKALVKYLTTHGNMTVSDAQKAANEWIAKARAGEKTKSYKFTDGFSAKASNCSCFLGGVQPPVNPPADFSPYACPAPKITFNVYPLSEAPFYTANGQALGYDVNTTTPSSVTLPTIDAEELTQIAPIFWDGCQRGEKYVVYQHWTPYTRDETFQTISIRQPLASPTSITIGNRTYGCDPGNRNVTFTRFSGQTVKQHFAARTVRG